MPDNRKTRRTDVQMTRIDCDWNNLAWQTIQNFSTLEGNPPPENSLEDKVRFLLSQDVDWGTVYANPGYVVRSSSVSQHFMLSAKRAQSSWLHRVRQTLGNSGFQKEQSQATPLMRTLQFTGLLILNGRHVRNDQWPATSQTLRTRTFLEGQEFGRLTVIKVESQGRCLCRCQCGNETHVQRQHLVSGRTQSCGCLRSELDHRIQEHKSKWAWIKTGILS